MPLITLLKLSTIVLCLLLAAVHADHKSSKKNPTIKPTANPSPASSLCKSRTLDQVRELYSHWNSALQTRDSNIVAAEYWDDSILLPTISNSIRYNKASKIEYFKDFLKKKPYGTVTEDFIDNTACNYVQYNGKYDFSLTNPTTGVASITQARFTFVFTTIDGKVWKIKTHHSSVLPEPVIAPSAAPKPSMKRSLRG